MRNINSDKSLLIFVDLIRKMAYPIYFLYLTVGANTTTIFLSYYIRLTNLSLIGLCLVMGNRMREQRTLHVPYYRCSRGWKLHSSWKHWHRRSTGQRMSCWHPYSSTPAPRRVWKVLSMQFWSESWTGLCTWNRFPLWNSGQFMFVLFLFIDRRTTDSFILRLSRIELNIILFIRYTI